MIGHPDLPEHLGHAARARLEIATRKSEGHVRGDIEMWKQRIVLEHEADPARLGGQGRALARDALPGDRDPSCLHVLQPGGQTQQGRLAASRRPDQADEFAAVDMHGHIGEHMQITEAMRHVVDREGGFRCGVSPCCDIGHGDGRGR